ncbi:MAG: SDR family NAD(P)-dependent oxidoreductase [Myxococcota bacterium]|nr:SDR family NAD(P)-dependent oxidoreductase [Myxococcota bacterium]
MTQIAGKTAVITGAGSGIGRALALGLAQKGARVALADIDEPALEKTVAEVRARGGFASSHIVDVSNLTHVQAFMRSSLDAHGAVHILINNAGITCCANFLKHTPEDWTRILSVNLMGVVHGCQTFLPHLLSQDAAHIVNISSLFGMIGIPGQSAYCASKFAVRGLSETLWIELAGSNVHLTLVHPGGISTQIIDNARFSVPNLHDHMRKTFTRMMPPEHAAARIIRGIERNRRRVLITPEAHIGDWLKRVMPVRAVRIFAELMSRGMRLNRFQDTVQLRHEDACAHQDDVSP